MARVCTVVGVGPGLGRALVERFGEEGYWVNMIARDRGRLERTRDEFAARGVESGCYPADVSDVIGLRKALDASVQDAGAPGLLVYNAAALRTGDLLSYDVEDYVADHRVNVLGAIETVRRLMPAMDEDGGGRVILTGGGLAHQPQQGAASLSLGKTGVLAVAVMLQQAFAGSSLSVATVTVEGNIEEGTRFSPERIADFYRTVSQDRSGRVEFVYD